MWAGSGWLGCGVWRIGHPSMYACQLMVPCVDSALKSMKSSPRLGAVRGQGSGLRACGRRVQRGTACTRRWAARAGRGVRGSGRRVSAVRRHADPFFAAHNRCERRVGELLVYTSIPLTASKNPPGLRSSLSVVSNGHFPPPLFSEQKALALKTEQPEDPCGHSRPPSVVTHA